MPIASPFPPSLSAVRRSSLGWALLLCPLLSILSPACAPPADQEPDIETVELGAGPTDALTPERDPTGSGASERFAGQLPPSFPMDLPVPPSSSVMEAAAGRVVFATEDPLEDARNLLDRELGRAGWQRQPDSDVYLKGERRVRIRWTGSADRSTAVYRY